MIVAGILVDKDYVTTLITSSNVRRPDPVREFKKGIKRDQNLFPMLSRETAWNNYHESLVIEAKSQDLEEVINPSYVPHSKDSSDFFDKKQKLMTAVFKRILKTDKGKSIVRKYAKTSNA